MTGCDRWVVAGIIIAVATGAVLAWRPGTVTIPASYQPPCHAGLQRLV